MPEKDQENLQKFLNSFSEEGLSRSIEHRAIDSSGAIRWIQWTDTAFFDEFGEIGYFQAVGRDITDRKRIEEELRESEEKYRTIFENAPLGLFRSTPEGQFIEVNRALAEMLGYDSPDSALKEIHSIAEQIYVNSEDRQPIVDRQSQSDAITNYHNRYRRRGGEEFIADLYLKAIRDSAGRILYLEGIVQDITERKRFEEAVRESEARYRRIVDTANEGIWELDGNHVTVYVNQVMGEMLGYYRAEMLNQHVSFFMFEEDIKDHDEQMSLRREGLSGIYLRRFRTKKGGELWTKVHARALCDGKGKYIGSFAMLTDVTEQKQAEEALRTSKEFLQTQSLRLEQVNIALKVLLDQREAEKRKTAEDLKLNIRRFILPHLESLEAYLADPAPKAFVEIVKTNLELLTARDNAGGIAISADLTPTEMRVADLIRSGRNCKDIASLLNISIDTVSFHRKNIRRKLGITSKRINLQSYLRP